MQFSNGVMHSSVVQQGTHVSGAHLHEVNQRVLLNIVNQLGLALPIPIAPQAQSDEDKNVFAR